MKTLKVRGVTLGEGREKIICSIMDPKIEDALETMELVKKSRVDAIEYRGDWSEESMILPRCRTTSAASVSASASSRYSSPSAP